jgi:hypothetical protein
MRGIWLCPPAPRGVPPHHVGGLRIAFWALCSVNGCPIIPTTWGLSAYCPLTHTGTLAAICRTKSTLFDAYWCAFERFLCFLQRGCIPRSGCQRQRAGQRAGTKAQGGVRPDGSRGARRSPQADHAEGAFSRPDGSRAQRQAATDSSRGRIARAQGKPLASGANPSRKPPAPARARRRTGQRRRSSPETDQQCAAAAPRQLRNTDRRGRGAKTKRDAQPSSRPRDRRRLKRGGGARGEGVYRFAFPRKSGGSERAAERRRRFSSSPQRGCFTRQRRGFFP